MLFWRESFLLLVAYSIGCFAVGYYVVLWYKGVDLREVGSKSIGATNAARVMGKAGFISVFLGDIARGALVALMGLWFQLPVWGTGLLIIAVMLGHIWPVQLRFQGGKGVAVFLGGVLIWDPHVFIGLWVVYGVVFLLTRRHKPSSFVSALSLSFVAFFLHQGPFYYLILAAISIIILLAHRAHVVSALTNRKQNANI